MYGRNILIVAAHPDDEVVGCGAAIERARMRGCHVHVLFLTTGVPPREALWPWQRRGHGRHVDRRRAEATHVAERAGLDIAGFLPTAARQLRLVFSETRERIKTAIGSLGADALWVPAFEGGHQDHDTANAIASTLAMTDRTWEYAEYNFAGGQVRAQTFPQASDAETVLTLTPAEREAKARLLAAYGSEAANLRHIGLDRECFRPLGSYDYGRAPHPGKLFYSRFQWVPFCHPRVDFTESATVYRELVAATHAIAEDTA